MQARPLWPAFSSATKFFREHLAASFRVFSGSRAALLGCRVQTQLPASAPNAADAAACRHSAEAISGAVSSLLAGRSVAGSSVAVLIHTRGDDAHGASDRGGAMLGTAAAREGALTATTAAGCGVNLQAPDWAVVLTMWREVGSEAATVGVALVPGASIRTKPRLAPVRLLLTKGPKPSKKRSKPDSGGKARPPGARAEPPTAARAPVELCEARASELLREALQRRSALIAQVAQPDSEGEGASADESERNDCWRLVHCTGDGFDGLTADFVGLGADGARVLIEAHHRWARVEPLAAAVRVIAAEGLLPHTRKVAVYVKHRYTSNWVSHGFRPAFMALKILRAKTQ